MSSVFNDHTDAFERLVQLGVLTIDHKQRDDFDYSTQLKAELRKRDQKPLSKSVQGVQKGRKEIHRTKPKTISTPIHHVQKPLSVKDLLTKRKPTEWVIEQIGAKGNLVLLAGESGCGKTSLMY